MTEGRKEIIGHLREYDMNINDWSLFKPRLENYFVANEIKCDERKRAILLNVFSEETYKLVFNLCLPEIPEKKTYNDLCKIITEHFKPEQSIFAARYKFFKAVKSQTETPKEWAARIRSLALHCEFTSEEIDTVLRDKFIVGFESGKVQERLFEEKKDLKFAAAIDIATAKTAAHHTALQLQVKQESLLQMTSSGGSSQRKLTSTLDRKAMTPGTNFCGSNSTGGGNKCTACGKANHIVNNCYFKNVNCHVCNKKGHIASVCRNKNIKFNKDIVKNRNSQNFVEIEEDTIFTMEDNVENIHPPVYLNIETNNKLIHFQLDSGACTSAIPLSIYNQHFSNIKLNKSKKILYGFNKMEMKPEGYVKLKMTYDNQNKDVIVYVIKNAVTPIVGRNFMEQFQIKFYCDKVNYINANSESEELTHKFKALFAPGLGTFNKGTIHLNLKEGAVPKFCKPRPLPFALKSKVEEELDRLVKLGVISSVDFADWGTPIVPIVKKDGTIRICGDFKITVNPNLIIDKFPLPRIEELFTRLDRGVIFSKLDLSRAYQQICVDEESKEIITISTHKGLYRYNRLPFGVACAPAKFQKIMENLLNDIEGCVVFLDDILVSGKNKEEHFKRLQMVLNRLENAGFKLSVEKCDLFKSSVEYLGYRIDAKGLHPLGDKVSAIINAPTPTNITQLRSVLGMIIYYAKFVPHLATILNPLYNLTKKDVKWSWDYKCQNAFKEVKRILCAAPILAHFNPELPSKLVTDASEVGLGAILMQKGDDGTDRVIAFASRTLSSAERQYSQIEKEGAGIMFGINKFYQYLYGTHFTLVTDHKPLVAIFNPKKGIPQYSANRLRRWAIILGGFSYDIEFVKSNQNLADVLSRLPVKNNQNCCNSEEENYISYFTNDYVPIDLGRIAECTRKDTILNTVMCYIKKGWPVRISDDIKPFLKYKMEFTIIKNCLVWNHRIVIPRNLQRQILFELHRTHLGICKMKSVARSYFWWPAMSEDIEQTAKNCHNCMLNKKEPNKIPLNSWSWPENPWERIHIDYMGPYLNKYFLIITDAHSKWLEVAPTVNITTQTTINVLRTMFARFGICKTVVSDNATAFTSVQFQKFLKDLNIEHITSPPYNPASNGAAENSVQNVKNSLKRAIVNNNTASLEEKLTEFLMDYRNSAHSTTGVTPAFLMFRRNLITRFSKMTDLNLENVDFKEKLKEVKLKVQRSLNNQAKNYTGNRKIIFDVGDKIYFRNPLKKIFEKGMIIKQLGKCNYLIQPKNSEVICKRHTNQILKDDSVNELPIVDICNANIERPINQNAISVDSRSDDSCMINQYAVPTIKRVDNGSDHVVTTPEIRPEEESAEESSLNLHKTQQATTMEVQATSSTNLARPQRLVKKPIRFCFD